jgi:hypothetical protein
MKSKYHNEKNMLLPLMLALLIPTVCFLHPHFCDNLNYVKANGGKKRDFLHCERFMHDDNVRESYKRYHMCAYALLLLSFLFISGEEGMWRIWKV